jgi:putative glutamine amidotransferase
MKPLIGITMNLEVRPARSINALDHDYGKAVHQAGGIPVPVLGIDGCIPDLVKRCDGFLFSGGDDIHPRFYHEKPIPDAKLEISPDRRTQFEIRLLKAAHKAKKPILAICGGEQLVNVAFGGSLYQDIALQLPGTVAHSASRKGQKVFHCVDIVDNSLLFRIMGAARIRVRSAHHQSVKVTGTGLSVSAKSRDDVIEALELRSNAFLIAVQWHPEKMPYDQYTKKLIKAFINASKKQ